MHILIKINKNKSKQINKKNVFQKSFFKQDHSQNGRLLERVVKIEYNRRSKDKMIRDSSYKKER